MISLLGVHPRELDTATHTHLPITIQAGICGSETARGALSEWLDKPDVALPHCRILYIREKEEGTNTCCAVDGP